MSQPFSAGSVLGKTFSIWGKNAPSFLTLALLVFSPWLVVTVLVFHPGATHESQMDYARLNLVAVLLLGYIGQGAVTYGVVRELSGHRASIADCIKMGFSSMLPVVGTAFLSGLAAGIGFFLLLVPGVIIMCQAWVAVPSAVIERLGPMAAFRRSRDLTEGHKWTIFGVLVVLILISVGIARFTMAFLPKLPTIEEARTYNLIRTATQAVMVSLGAVASSVGYQALRTARDGVNIEELARVFD